ncbi:MAG: TetR/AcrR family transcriptional regulator [Spirochaetia bacterium]
MGKREKILETALHLFSSRGYDAVGIQEVADKAGIGKPTIYHYFGNKKGVLSSLVQYYIQDFLSDLQRTAEYHGDATWTLTRVAEYFFVFTEKYPTFFRLMLSLSLEAPESTGYSIIRPYIVQEQRILLDMFIRMAEQHGNMKGREKQYAFSFIGILNVYCELLLQEELTIDQKMLHMVVHQFMHGIFS